MNTKEVFSQYFNGTWDIYRNIKRDIKAIGSAKFTQHSENIVLYREEVKLICNDNVINAHQEYLYKYIDGQIFKYFINEKLFYKLVLDGNKACGYHLCNQDSYNAHYLFKNPNSFLLKYIVHGTNKDYMIETDFTRNRER